jgi:uncharacterized protein DUF5648
MPNVTAVPLRFFYAAGYDVEEDLGFNVGRHTTRWHMTTDSPEIYAMLTVPSVKSPDWKEDVGHQQVYVFNQPVVGTVTLYRYLNRLSGDHFFTTSAEEGNQAIAKYDCVSEGISCYLSPTQVPFTVPLYRLLVNKKYHHYLIDPYERAQEMAGKFDSISNVHWPASDEGITGFVWTSPVSLPAQ